MDQAVDSRQLAWGWGDFNGKPGGSILGGHLMATNDTSKHFCDLMVTKFVCAAISEAKLQIRKVCA